MSSTTYKGVVIPILQSDSNFPAWQRVLEGIARQHGLWSFFTGEEIVLPKPDKPVRPNNREAQPDPAVWRGLQDDYKLDVEEYRHQQEKIGEALGLLTQTVAPAYHTDIFAHNSDIYAAFRFVKDQFQQTEWQRLNGAWDRFFKASLYKSKGMSQYIDELKQAQSDIKEAKGVCNDSVLVARIGDSLPKEYDDWVLKNIKLAKDQPKLSDITASLLALESMNKSRKARGGQTSSSTTKSQDNNKQPSGDSSRPKCTECKKIGHTVDTCYNLRPELKEEHQKIKKEAAVAMKEAAITKDKEKDKTTVKVIRNLGALAWVSPHLLQQARDKASLTDENAGLD